MKIKTLLICTSLLIGTANANINPAIGCEQLPAGDYQIDGFANYIERQKDPKQNDITIFHIDQVTPYSLTGYVQRPDQNNHQKMLTYKFSADCSEERFINKDSQQVYDELVINFFAAQDSLINLCSGIYNLDAPQGFGHAMYIGGPNMITGDDNFNYCQVPSFDPQDPNNYARYGVIFPQTMSSKK